MNRNQIMHGIIFHPIDFLQINQAYSRITFTRTQSSISSSTVIHKTFQQMLSCPYEACQLPQPYSVIIQHRHFRRQDASVSVEVEQLLQQHAQLPWETNAVVIPHLHYLYRNSETINSTYHYMKQYVDCTCQSPKAKVIDSHGEMPYRPRGSTYEQDNTSQKATQRAQTWSSSRLICASSMFRLAATGCPFLPAATRTSASSVEKPVYNRSRSAANACTAFTITN